MALVLALGIAFVLNLGMGWIEVPGKDKDPITRAEWNAFQAFCNDWRKERGYVPHSQFANRDCLGIDAEGNVKVFRFVDWRALAG